MTVTAEQAAEDFQALLGRAEQGETIIIERAGRPVVSLQPASASTRSVRRRVFGRLQGQGVVPEDIKTPYEKEINEMFYGE